MAFNTGNPVPSTDGRDLSDNAEALDKIVNQEVTVTTRTGKQIKSIPQIVDPVDAAGAQGLIDIAADVDAVNAAGAQGLIDIAADVDAVNAAADGFDAVAIDRLNDLDAAYVFTAINNGVWAEFETFTALNQYMVFTGTAYKPKNSTSLPYVVGATPVGDNNVEVVGNLSTAQGDQRYVKNQDLATATADLAAVVGMSVRITDRGDGLFDWVSGETPDGFSIIEHDILPIQLKLRVGMFIDPKKYGVLANFYLPGTKTINPSRTDDTLAMQAAIDTRGPIDLPANEGIFVTSRLDQFTTVRGAGRDSSVIGIDATFSDTAVLFNELFFAKFIDFHIDLRQAPTTDIIGIWNWDGRNSTIDSVRITGNSVDGTGVKYDKGANPFFSGFHLLQGCYISGIKIGMHYDDIITASSAVHNKFIGFQAPIIPGSMAVKIEPSSGSGCSIQDNEIEGWDTGVFSEGTVVKVALNRFETNNIHIKLVRGAGNTRIWSSILDNKYLGTGTVIFPKNNTDFVTRFEEEGMRNTTVIPTFGGGIEYHGSGTSLTQTFYGAFPSSAAIGQYIRFGSVSFDAQFQQATIRGTVSIARNGVNHRGELDFKLNVFQSAVMGDPPSGKLTQWGDRIAGNNIFAVAAVNDVNDTVIELWMQNGDNVPAVIYEISSVSTLSNYAPDNTGTFQSSLPAGPQIGAGVLRVTDSFEVGGVFRMTDGITAPSTVAGVAQTYVDIADGDYKIKFGDGTVKVIASNP